MLFRSIDGVELIFEPEAVEEIARLAIARSTGVRGLRSILEDVLLDTMFDVPGRKDVQRGVITSAAVRKEAEPLLEVKKPKPRQRRAS